MPLIVRCVGDIGSDGDAVGRRFAGHIARLLLMLGPDVLVLSGGDTALAVLAGFGVSVVRPRGEAAPGLPWFEIAVAGRTIRCVVKSGGFGPATAFSDLLPPA